MGFFFISKRYISADKRSRKISPGILSAGGIAVGVMALISVISVMNGFQLGFIENIIEISSYHIRVNSSDPEVSDKISKINGVKNILTFYETKTLLNSTYNIEPCIVKGIPSDAEMRDPGLFKQLNIYRGKYEPDNKKSIVIGRILAIKLGLGVGDTISVFALNGASFSKLSPETTDFIISGIFNCGYDDFDSSMIIMNDEALISIDNNAEAVTGIKLNNRFRDTKAINEILNKTELKAEDVISWRIYNKAFFSALKLEKNVMFLMLGLIFIVVSFGIYNSTRRTIAEKQEEIGIIRAIGATPVNIRQIFIFDGLIIGLGGGITGTVAGLLITININEILGLISMNTSSFLVNIPVRIIPTEVISIFLFAVAFCMISAYAASAKVSAITPQEVLRYE